MSDVRLENKETEREEQRGNLEKWRSKISPLETGEALISERQRPGLPWWYSG